MKAPTSAELAHLTHTIAQRVGRCLERQGLLERDAENSYVSGDIFEAGPLYQLFGRSITYRIAVGPHQGRKVFTQQTLVASMSEGITNAKVRSWPISSISVAPANVCY